MDANGLAYEIFAPIEVSLQLLLIAILSVAALRGDRKQSVYGHDSSYGICALGLAMVSIMVSWIALSGFFGGELSADEYAMSRIYVEYFFSGIRWISGATQLAEGAFLASLYSVFGFSAIVARSGSLALFVVGLIFLYFVVRRLVSHFSALWSVTFLAASSYGAHFSGLALELVAVFFFTPAVLLATIGFLERPTISRGAFLGSITAISFFTYPGQILAVVSLVLSVGVVYLLRLLSGRPFYFNLMPSLASRWRGVLAAVLSSGAVIILGSIVHFKFMGTSRMLFTGGGGGRFSLEGYLEGLTLIMHELIDETQTYYLAYPLTPFLDRLILPFALFGVIVTWSRNEAHLLRVLALAAVVTFFLIPLTGGALGARRLVFLLLPMSILAATGLEHFIFRVSRLVAFSVVLLLAGGLFWRKILNFEFSSTSLFESGYCATLLPDTLLLNPASEGGEILVSQDEYGYWLDVAAMKSTLALHTRFNDNVAHSELRVADSPTLARIMQSDAKQHLFTMEPQISLTPLLAIFGECLYVQKVALDTSKKRNVYAVASSSLGDESARVCDPVDLERLPPLPRTVLPRYEYCAEAMKRHSPS